MLKHVFLIDVTRHLGPVLHVADAVRAYSARFEPAVTEWFGKPAQFSAIGTEGTHFHQVGFETNLYQKISARIDALAADGYSDAIFHVLSHDGHLLNAATKLSGASRTVTCAGLGAVVREAKDGGSPRRVQALVSTETSSSSIPLSEAIELTKKLLAEQNYISSDRALKLSSLRGLLVQRDSRARVHRFDLNSTKLISNIVQDGRTKGWCQGRSKSRPVGRSKSEPVGSAMERGFAGEQDSGA